MHRADPRHHLAQLRRLGDVVVRSQFQPDDALGFLAAAGDHDDAAVMQRRQPADQRDTAGVGQFEVDQHHVRHEAALEFDRLGAGLRPGRAHSRALDEFLQGLRHGRVVLDQEDTRVRQRGCGVTAHHASLSMPRISRMPPPDPSAAPSQDER
jgi:hypothetical protein